MTLMSKFNGIVDKVAQDLLHAAGIGKYKPLRAWLIIYRQLKSFFTRFDRVNRRNIIDQIQKVNRFGVEGQLTSFYF